MEINQLQLHEVINRQFSFDEFQVLCSELKIDIDNLPGEGIDAKTRELIAFMERNNRFNELVDKIRRARPLAFDQLKTDSMMGIQNADAAGLNMELVSLRQQLVEIQESSLSQDEIEHRLAEVLKVANRAIGRSDDLTARIILPQPEDMNVRLVPSHSLDRLEEYRSDQSIGYLLIGLFTGSIVGILSDWASNEQFMITRFSLVLMILFIVLTVFSILFVWKSHSRAKSVKKSMWGDS